MSLDSMLDKASAKKETKKSKTTTPTVKIEDGNVDKMIDDWIDAKQAETTNQAKRKNIEEVLRPIATEARRAHIREAGKSTNAVKLNGKVKFNVTTAVSTAYSKVPKESDEALREVFGDDFDEFFALQTGVKLTKEGARDMEMLQKIIDAIGEETFFEVFEIERFYQPTERFIVDRDLKPEVSEKHDQAVDEGLLKQRSPSFTV